MTVLGSSPMQFLKFLRSPSGIREIKSLLDTVVNMQKKAGGSEYWAMVGVLFQTIAGQDATGERI